MKLLSFIILSFYLLLSSQSLADKLEVRSGEHKFFSRLVIPVPAGTNWEVLRNATEVILTLRDHNDGFDIGEVFERILKTRIKELSATDNQLSVALNCPCDVAVFATGTGYLVIDVAATGKTIAPPLPIDSMQNANTTVLLDVTSRETQTLPEQSLLPLSSNQSARSSLIDDPLSLPLRTALERSILNDVRSRLTKNVGAAMTSGLLKPDNIVVADAVVGTASVADPNSKRADVTEDTQWPVFEQSLENHVRVTTSLDLPKSKNRTDNDPVPTNAVCPNNDHFKLSSWGSTADFQTQIANGRRQLYTELGRINDAAALQLARTYLFFGFGIEAKRVLYLSNDLRDANADLVALSTILDQGYLPEDATLANLTDCNSDAALWAILARPEIRDGASVNTDAVLLALNELPKHLRQFLAPMLSNRLLEFGLADAAAAALRSLERLPQPLAAEAVLASAQLKLAAGQTETAQQQLESVIDANAAPSPIALIALVESKVSQNKPILIETAKLVEAYAHELRDTELGSDLKRAHVLASAKSGQYDKAFEVWRGYADQASEANAKSLAQNLMHELTTAASDIVFLEHVFRQSDSDLARMDAGTITQASRRVLGNGFAGAAQSLLAYLPIEQRDNEALLLEAEIAIKLNQPQRAITALALTSEPAAERLRAEAQKLAGNHAAAHSIYMRLDDQDDAAAAAWLSEEWDSLTSVATPIFGEVAQLANQAPMPIKVGAGMLERTAAALEESSLARGTIDTLLNSADMQVKPLLK